MKTPLRYQVTEYDCATTSLYNAISYLFERHEIPAKTLQIIHKYTLDCYDNQGNPGQGGTSKEAVEKIVNNFNHYDNNKFNITCKTLEGENITLERINKCLKNNGCIFVKVWLELVEHYIIITKIIKNKVYIFDPYYLDKNKYKDNDVKIILNKPYTHNRIVTLERLFSETNKDFSLGAKDKRECVLMNKN